MRLSKAKPLVLLLFALLSTACAIEEIEPARLDPAAQATSAVERGAEEVLPIKTAHPSPTPSLEPLPTATASPSLEALGDPIPEGRLLVGTLGERVVVLNEDGSLNDPLPNWEYVDAASDLELGAAEEHNGFALRSISHDITESDYWLNLFWLPGLENARRIRLLSEQLRWDWAHSIGPYAGDPAIMAVGMPGTMMWSPNGRYLGIVAAIDGPSADVYAYAPHIDQALRLTDGPNQAVLMGWSPDSRWLVHMEAEFVLGPDGPTYKPIAVWAGDVLLGPANYLYESTGEFGDSERIIGWRSEREFVVADVDEFETMRGLTSVDVLSGERKLLYRGQVAAAAADPASGSVAFVTFGPKFLLPQGHPTLTATSEPKPEGQHLQGGIYLISPGQEDPQRLDYDDWLPAFDEMAWFPELGQFVNPGSRTVSFSPEGDIVVIYPEVTLPWVSPNGSWLAFRGTPNFPRLAVYSSAGELILEIDGVGVADIAWTNDSAGFYLQTHGSEISFVSIPDGELIQIRSDSNFRIGPLTLIELGS